MTQTLINSFKLRNTYRVNSIIYSLKSIPLIKKLLPSSLYASRGLKTFGNVVSAIAELLSAFSGKALYLLIIYLVMSETQVPAAGFVHALIFLTVAGGIANTQIFNPTKDKFYAIFCLRMEAKKYTLVNYGYFLVKMLVGFLGFALLFGLLCGVSVIACLAVPLYVVEVKLCFSALSLRDYKKQSVAINENKLTPLLWGVVVLLMALAVVPPCFFDFALGGNVLLALVAALLVPAVLSARYIVRFDSYRSVYKELLRPENIAMMSSKELVGASQQLAMQKKITMDVGLTSNKKGYAYFNEIFMKRHSKLLTKSAKRITMIAAAVFVLAAAACRFYPEINRDVNEMMLTFLPYFLFVMYLINRGQVITQAMFLNCDHSMLAYRFYRKPKAILTLFIARLKYVVLINLMPASVIAVGLPALLYLSGGTDDVRNYYLLFVSILSMSVFFSVHHMVMYYLLQPYNVSLEMKNATYGIVSYVTYFICYIAIGKQVPTVVFGTAVTAFCIVYVLVAFVLAYRLAPKTFKLRT